MRAGASSLYFTIAPFGLAREGGRDGVVGVVCVGGGGGRRSGVCGVGDVAGETAVEEREKEVAHVVMASPTWFGPDLM